MTNYRKNRHRVHKGFGEPSLRQKAMEMHHLILRTTADRVQAQQDLAHLIEESTTYRFLDCGQFCEADGSPATPHRDLVMESPSGNEIVFRVFDDRTIEWDGDLPAEVKQVAEGFV